MRKKLRQITLDDFLVVQLHVGMILSARPNPEAKKTAYVLEVDFGEYGKKISSAQITENYSIEDLIGKQVVAVLNFPPKKIAGVTSEVLILGAVSETYGTILLEPDKMVENGTLIL